MKIWFPFPKKMALDCLIKFGIIKALNQYFMAQMTIFFKNIQGFPCFSEKIILYLLKKFGIIKPWTNIPWLTRFDWGFWQSSKQFCRKFQYRENAFGNIQVCLVFPEKLFCIRWLNLALLSLESIFHGPQDSI